MAIKGKGGEWRRFPAMMEEYENIRDFVMDEAEKSGLSAKEQMWLDLGMEEAVVNVINHAYDIPGEVWLKFSKDGNEFTVDMADFGVPFNPLTKNAVPSPDIPLEERKPGGYGIMLMKKTFAKLAYSHEPIMGKDANHLRMVFRRIPGTGAQISGETFFHEAFLAPCENCAAYPGGTSLGNIFKFVA